MSERAFEVQELETVAFEPGEILFEENNRTYHFYIIQEGSVEIFKQGLDKDEIPLAIAHKGEAVGEFAVISNKPRSASARALTQVVAVKVAKEVYTELFQNLPEWAQSMLESLVFRLQKMDEILKKHGVVDKELQSHANQIRTAKGSHSQR